MVAPVEVVPAAVEAFLIFSMVPLKAVQAVEVDRRVRTMATVLLKLIVIVKEEIEAEVERAAGVDPAAEIVLELRETQATNWIH